MEKHIILALMGLALIIMPSSAMAITTIHIKQGAYVQGSPGFDPKIAHIKSGDTVNWKNDDSVPHTATSGLGPGSDAGKIFNTGQIDPSTMSKDVQIAQSTPYFCMIHPFIVGKISMN